MTVSTKCTQIKRKLAFIFTTAFVNTAQCGETEAWVLTAAIGN